MTTTALSGTLRILTAATVVGTIGYVGYVHRSPWVIPLFAVVFVVLYAFGKLPQWIALWDRKGLGGILFAVLVTFPVQIFLAGLFYLVGFGLGAMIDDRPGVDGLTAFDIQLAAALFIGASVVSAIIFVLERNVGGGDDAADDDGSLHPVEIPLSSEIQLLMDEAAALSEQTVAMPIQIFSLARRFEEHNDLEEALVVLDAVLFDDENAFVRRVAMTAVRFIGQEGRDAQPTSIDARIIAGMKDPAPWVRYDAAWVAGELEIDHDRFQQSLERMIANAEHDTATNDETSAEYNALERARKSLAVIEARKNA
ncbi:MAG: hypothetical protein ACRBCJ_11645 [Hyphomicrobiaceae bacterium]